MSKKLNAKERAWLAAVQAVLDKCPSERLGFYTIGDNVVCLYDRTHYDAITEEGGDLVHILKREGWGFDESLIFPEQVEGVCG